MCVCCDVQVAEELQSGPMSSEEKELLHLLTSPHLKVSQRAGGRQLDLSVFPAVRHLSCCISITLTCPLTRPLSRLSSHQAVLSVHDTVAQKNFDPVLPPLPDDLEDELEEESVKIVRLVKNKEPLVSRTGAAREAVASALS